MDDKKRLVDLILLAGKLMLINGAETQRVEETIVRMGRAGGFAQVEVLTTPTGIFITAKTLEDVVFTQVGRTRGSDYDLSVITRINQLSRIFSQQPDVDWLEKSLKALENESKPIIWKGYLAGGLASASFGYIFGGGYLDILYSFLVGFMVIYTNKYLNKASAPRFLATAICAAISASLGALAGGLGLSRDVILLSGVRILVPGITMTAAIRDTLNGDLVAGVGRGAEAFSTAVIIAVGVGVVLAVSARLGGLS